MVWLLFHAEIIEVEFLNFVSGYRAYADAVIDHQLCKLLAINETRSCPHSCGKRRWRILPVGTVTDWLPCKAATGGTRHGEEYQEAGHAA